MKVAKVILVVFIIALIVGSILFCLPKSADTLLGGSEITSFSCVVIQDIFEVETSSFRHDVWKADYDTNTEKTVAQLAEMLSSSRYRPMLKTLWQPNQFEPNGDYYISLILIMEDGSHQMIEYMGDDLVLLRSSPLNLILRPTDKEVCDRLAEFIKKIGEKS